jgi:hypothetical protein
LPNKLVWKQDNVTYHRFYWIGVPKGSAKDGDLIRAEVEGQTLQIVAAEGPDRILLSLNDALVDLDQPLRITGPDGSLLFEGKVTRSIETAQRTFAERADPAYIFFAELLVDLNAKTVTPL